MFRSKGNKMDSPIQFKKQHAMKHIFILVTAMMISQPTFGAESSIRLAGLFSNHMVMQRDRVVPVWGWAKPGGKVTLEFASQQKTVTADSEGRWTVNLDPIAVNATPQTMEISSEMETLAIKDILIGDVWLCSGQSNMFFRMNKVEDSQKEIKAANHPDIRFFAVKEQFAKSPATTVNGTWQPVSPASAGECSAVAYYFATALKPKLGIPIGLLISSVGGTRIETWMQPQTLVSIGESNEMIDKWKNVSVEEFGKIAADYRAYQYRRDTRHSPTTTKPDRKATLKPPTLRCHDCPGALHFGMIAPLQPFALRGFLWYQGEANSGRPVPYQKLLPALIEDWRKAWGADLPFLFVQLAPYRGTHPAFREAQHNIWKKTPNTAMVVTTDVGDPTDIHPTRKQPVGERLALAARALSYGENLVYSGPVFEKLEVKGVRAFLTFTHSRNGLIAKGGELKGFTLAGSDGKFHSSQAEIQGSKVVVTSDKVTQPVAVRYGWAMVPEGNLFNLEGLPAAPFRTDSNAADKKPLRSK
jgi:sialate O-acetylesterase